MKPQTKLQVSHYICKVNWIGLVENDQTFRVGDGLTWSLGIHQEEVDETHEEGRAGEDAKHDGTNTNGETHMVLNQCDQFRLFLNMSCVKILTKKPK